MADERGPKFEGDAHGSRHEARIDHHEEFGRIESNDYMGRARLKETFEEAPTFAAERSVDATGQAFDHQQYAQNDTAYASGSARYVEEGGLQTDISIYEDGMYVGSENAQEGGVFGSRAEDAAFGQPLREDSTAYGDYRSMGEEYRRRDVDEVVTTTDGDAGSDPAALSMPSSAAGLSGGATYLDTWANEEFAASRASVSESKLAGDEAQVIETAGDIYFVDRKFNYADELASEGDGKFDVDKILKTGSSKDAVVAEGEPDSILAKIGEKGKVAAKGVAKGAGLSLLDDATGGEAGDIGDEAVKGTPSAAKKAKGFYSKLHGLKEQNNLAAGQLAARRGIGKNFFRQAIRGNMVGTPGGNPLAVIHNVVKKIFSNVGSTLVKSGGAKVLLLAAGALLCVMLPVFAFSSCVISSGGEGGGNGAEAFTAWAERVAANDKIGYDQSQRTTYRIRDTITGPDGTTGWGEVDCSSFVYFALLENGWTEDELGGSYPFATFGMCPILSQCGFDQIDFDESKLQRGDIVVDVDQHVEIYCGEGKSVAAHCDENGGITGGQVGDQTGNEVSVSAFSTSYWSPDYILRCTRGGSGNAGNFEGNSNAEKAWNYFTSRGYSEAATAGIIGNLMQESSLDPNCVQYGGGPGRGIAQWEIGSDRYARLCSMASSWGYSWNDIEAQLMFIDWELNGNEATCAYLMNANYGGLSAFKTTGDVSNATLIFLKCYERAGIAAFSNRLQYALDAFAAFA